MPRLVLVNGLPGSGKSSSARRYADEHPLTLVLDVDIVRGLLGAWTKEPTRAGLLARDLALVMARTHLRGGRDVVVPQFLARLDFIEALASLAAELDVRFVEIALVVDLSVAARRLAHRALHPSRPEDSDAATLLARQGGPESLRDLQAQLGAVLVARPDTLRLAADGDLDSTLRALRGVLDEGCER
jgi:predicted kinase